MVMELIQEKVSLGQNVNFVLKTGNEIEGTVHEITSEYVSVLRENEVIVILEDLIGAWETKQDDQEFFGLSEDTVVEKVEFDWEENKTKDQTDSAVVFSSRHNNTEEKIELKHKVMYMLMGSGATLVIIFIIKFFNLV
ncbi:hypothetical protein [Candidatus Uabimicrobium amorphum]|uniref:Uncharacterized protein n=1 Tax=Uabimicrobium amorphum TaxID=2596890 RepID=A0A5S9IU56_UABAM|nr:hypothetical protein [Candidatus Uabimicrobium amorphum]BBM87827.1 hypothetical protein UABAM_06242 [Candidatus Uabimicrobium amorphum]